MGASQVNNFIMLGAYVVITEAVSPAHVEAELNALIAWPAAEPLFSAVLRGAERPPWTPHVDPRLDALAAGYALILGAAPDAERVKRVCR